MRIPLLAGAAVGALLTLSCSSVRPVAINAGDQCFRCRRPIVEAALAAEQIDGNGFVSKYRAPGCMAKYLVDHPQETGAMFVTDYATGKWIRPEQAVFVPTLVNPDTGEWDYRAFARQIDANVSATASRTVPVDWTAVLEKARSQS